MASVTLANSLASSFVYTHHFFIIMRTVISLIPILPVQNQNVVLKPLLKQDLELTRKQLVEVKQVAIIAGFSSVIVTMLFACAQMSAHAQGNVATPST